MAGRQREGLTIERDNPLDPVNLAFDKAGDLLVLSSAGPEGTVYSFRPGSPKDQITVLAPQETQAASRRAGRSAGQLLEQWRIQGPTRLQHVRLQDAGPDVRAKMCPPRKQRNTSHRTAVYFCPRGACSSRGRRTPRRAGASPTTWTLMVSSAPCPADHVYVSSESEDITYRALVGADGTLSDLQPFAQRGGESVAVDRKGNVYVANGQIFVYDRAGKQIARIDVPERPIDIVFGGAGGQHAVHSGPPCALRSTCTQFRLKTDCVIFEEGTELMQRLARMPGVAALRLRRHPVNKYQAPAGGSECVRLTNVCGA